MDENLEETKFLAPDQVGLLEKGMRIAIQEAALSLRERNHGFGAVILKDDAVLAQAHDTDMTDTDPTAHAELKVIRKAASLVGRDLSSCILVSTHEPCPMCAGAIIWSRIRRVPFGYGIQDAMGQGRIRIDMGCEEIFKRSPESIHLYGGLLKPECAVLYDKRVRDEIESLRGASDKALKECNLESKRKRLEWYAARRKVFPAGMHPLEEAYALLLEKLGMTEGEAPIVERDGRRIVFHSLNFCPTLEACRILQLDTRRVCRLYNEGATQELIRQIDPRLSFTRNYGKLRPYSAYCEERIEYSE